MPIASWLRTSLRDRLRAASDPEHLRRQGLFNPEPVQHWIAQLDSGRRDTSAALWSLLAFQSWMDGETGGAST
jgi:asparagine synthase (glutamine-hydrolysing)